MSEQEDIVEKINYGVVMITPGPQSSGDSNLVTKLIEDNILLRKDNMKLIDLISDLATRVDKLAQRNSNYSATISSIGDPVAPMGLIWILS